MIVLIVKRIRSRKSRDIEQQIPPNDKKQVSDAKKEGNNRDLIYTINQKKIQEKQSPQQMILQLDNLVLQDEAAVADVPRRSFAEDEMPQNLNFIEEGSKSLKNQSKE